MEDKRIAKTKKNLKCTLIDMLAEQPFEKITITALCSRTEISRITFYSHYSDKYALVDEMFQDMIVLGTKEYEKKQNETNPERNEIKSYCNIMDSILDIYYGNFDFFRHTAPDKNPYLAFALYSIILETVEGHTRRMESRTPLKYSAKKIAGFLCYGMIGFINESHEEKVPVEQIREEARELLVGILGSKALIRL